LAGRYKVVELSRNYDLLEMTEKAKTYQPAVPAATDNDYVALPIIISLCACGAKVQWNAPKDFLEELFLLTT